MTEVTGRGPLGAAAAAHLLRLLGALPGVDVAPALRWRDRPRGIEDGFDVGSDADRRLRVDPAAPDLGPLGDDLASLELELCVAGAAWVLAVTTRRDDAGTSWRAALDPLEGEPPPPPWWPAVLDAWGSAP